MWPGLVVLSFPTDVGRYLMRRKTKIRLRELRSKRAPGGRRETKIYIRRKRGSRGRRGNLKHEDACFCCMWYICMYFIHPPRHYAFVRWVRMIDCKEGFADIYRFSFTLLSCKAYKWAVFFFPALEKRQVVVTKVWRSFVPERVHAREKYEQINASRGGRYCRSFFVLLWVCVFVCELLNMLWSCGVFVFSQVRIGKT